MKKVFRYFTMMLAIGGATLTSCLDKEEIVNNQKEQYQDNWVKVFGNIDPDHDWSVAKQVNATFNLAGVVSGEHTARIYTEHPYNKKCKLLAEFKVNGSGTVSFDTEKTTKHVYIRVENAEGQMAFDGYFTIEGNELVADSRTIAGRSLSRATPNENYFDAHTIGSVQRDGKEELNEIKQDNSTTTTVDLGTIYYPKTPIQPSDTVTIGFNDYLIPIVNNSNTAIFQEFKDNRTKTSTQGVEYVTITNGEVQLDYVFGMTGLYNTIGYFYWNPDNGQTYADAPKIVLLEDAEPDKILGGVFYENGEQKEIAFSSIASENNQYGMVLNQYIRGDKTPPTQLIGKSYKLLYYGEDYQSAGTTTFPAGTHIGFFLYTNYWDTSRTSDNPGSPYKSNGDYAYGRQNPKDVETNSTYRTNLVYSIPAYNQAIKESYNYRINESDYQQQNGNQNYNVNIDKGEISAVTYNYQGKTILGFEDGVDKDMNDILFVVNANVEVAGGEVVNLGGSNNTPQTQSWIIACEDLGSIGDYDFNDAVFSVSHVGGSDTLTVTPLAAGGTYPIKLYYNGQPVRDEDFHKLIDGNANKQGDLWKPINADTKGTAGNSIIITNVPKNYSINQHGFSVEVEKNEGTSITIKQSMANDKEQKAPQMLILPGNWIWPKENMPIHSGYPRFAEWNADQQLNTDWYTNDIAEDKLVGSYGNQGGSGGTGGDIPEVEEPAATKYSIAVTVVDQASMDTIQTDNNGNDYLELPKKYFASSGNTQIVISGISETGNSIALQRVSDNNQLAWTSSNTLTVDASQVTGPVRIYIWQNSTDNFSEVNGVTITNNYQSNGGSEEPDDDEQATTIKWYINGTLQNSTLSYETEGTSYPVINFLKSDLGQYGADIRFACSETIKGGILYNGNKVEITNNQLTILPEHYTSNEFNNKNVIDINFEKQYTITEIHITQKAESPGEDNNDNNTLPIYVNEVKSQNVVSISMPNSGEYYLTIPAGTITNSTATIHLNGLKENGYSLEIRQNDATLTTVYTNQFTLTNINTNADIIIKTNLDENSFNAIQSIKITIGSETGGENPTTVIIPITVNDDDQYELTATDGEFTIPLSSYGLGDYGATITFNGNATILINEQSQSINDSWDYEVSSYSSLSVTITDGTIDSIVITNKEKPSGGGTGEGDSDLGISIEFTTNGTIVKISKSQLSKITTNSELYFLDNNNEKIYANHDIRTNIDNVVWTYSNQSNPYIITANNVEVINRSEVEYITMNFWDGTPTKIYLKIAE